MPFISSIRGNYDTPKKDGESILDKFEITGGNQVYTAGGYRIHMFTDDGTFSVKAKDPALQGMLGLVKGALTIEGIFIGGGGAGGGRHGGGGGGGGMVVTGGAALPAGDFTIGRGGGGAQSGTDDVSGNTTGGNTTFSGPTI